MTQEQMERAINFVIQHHAKFAADIQQLGEDIQQLKNVQTVTEQRLQQFIQTQAEAQAGNEKRFVQMNEAILSLTALAGRASKDHERIEDAQWRTDEKLAEAEERWRSSMNETNECLKGLIRVVERYIHSRNGKSENQSG